jgi:type II secretory pathway component PulJ
LFEAQLLGSLRNSPWALHLIAWVCLRSLSDLAGPVMTDSNRTRSSSPSDLAPSDFTKEREHLMQSFSRGSRWTEEALLEHERLVARVAELERDNAELRARVEKDDAVRELLSRIQNLEQEKEKLLSQVKEVEENGSRFSENFQQVESEFSNLVNLYVASNQLHTSLSPRGVMRRLKEVLAQLIGAESYAIYFANPDGSELVPIAAEGVSGEALVNQPIRGSRVGHVHSTGTSLIDADCDPSQGSLDQPAAILPLSIDDRVIGVVAIFSTLAQKNRFATLDFELFALLERQAAAALIGASLFTAAERRIPGLEAFMDLSV